MRGFWLMHTHPLELLQVTYWNHFKSPTPRGLAAIPAPRFRRSRSVGFRVCIMPIADNRHPCYSKAMALELLKPIQKRSAEARATDALRDQILRGGARPGLRLTEIGLSQQLSLSRSTIRTGLPQLANEGLVVQEPYTDWQVASLSGADAWELYTLRASLEALGTGLAVGALTQEGEPVIVAE